MSEASLPLAGLRVLDFSRLLPGPWATQFLGDMGAEVIKIEQPGIGDPARHNPPNYREGSAYFHSVNRNKRCIALDLSRPAGRDIALRLIDGADILVESFRQGVTSRLGIDEQAARARNPRLIYCSITGYGQEGPLSAVPGHDLVIQSITGLMAMHPEPDAPPPVPGFQAADYAGATGALSGILVALFRRERTGKGACLDISMFDNLMAMGNIVLTGAMARAAGHAEGPWIEVWGGNPRYATYATRDGKAVAVSLLEARTWERFCHEIGRPDLILAGETPKDRHTSHGERSDLYRAALSTYFAARDRDEAVGSLLAANIPICPVSTPDEALAQPQAAARGVVEWIDHPIEGRIPQLANPLSRSGFGNSRARPAASRLGADTDAVLRELGYDDDARKTLHQDGVVA